MKKVEPNRVKAVNQALVKEGYVRSRKATASTVANAIFWVSHKDLQAKVCSLFTNDR